ncbi:MAG TPA: phosphoglycerate mutase, partial [Ramlibacter sp.]|nr:phosphoglycerate mutase [Ramlibacter sp.]
LRLPHLQRLLRRLAVEATDAGDPASLSTPHERMLARACGLPSVEGLIPFAALQAKQQGHADGHGWAWITPTHWQVGRDRIAMAHPQDLRLDADDSQALLAAMQPWFAEDGITLAYDAPLRWLARGEIFRDLPTASLDRVMGRTLHQDWMPGGAAGAPLRRLQQEMQMLLYTLPLNDARQRGGLLPVNSFWASGTGALPAGHPGTAAGLQVTPYLRDAALRGDWRAWAAAWQQVDAKECVRLLEALDKGRAVRITLCGEAGARTWSSAAATPWQRVTGWFGTPSVPRMVEGL